MQCNYYENEVYSDVINWYSVNTSKVLLSVQGVYMHARVYLIKLTEMEEDLYLHYADSMTEEVVQSRTPNTEIKCQIQYIDLNLCVLSSKHNIWSTLSTFNKKCARNSEFYFITACARKSALSHPPPSQ